MRKWKCNTNDRNQQWTYDVASKLIKATHGKCLGESGGFRFAISSLKCCIATDAAQRNTNGGLVHMWHCDKANTNQHWTYNNSTEQIKAIEGKCLGEHLWLVQPIFGFQLQLTCTRH